MEGRVSQNFDLGPSFHLIKEHLRKYQKSYTFFGIKLKN